MTLKGIRIQKLFSTSAVILKVQSSSPSTAFLPLFWVEVSDCDISFFSFIRHYFLPFAARTHPAPRPCSAPSCPLLSPLGGLGD